MDVILRPFNTPTFDREVLVHEVAVDATSFLCRWCHLENGIWLVLGIWCLIRWGPQGTVGSKLFLLRLTLYDLAASWSDDWTWSLFQSLHVSSMGFSLCIMDCLLVLLAEQFESLVGAQLLASFHSFLECQLIKAWCEVVLLNFSWVVGISILISLVLSRLFIIYQQTLSYMALDAYYWWQMRIRFTAHCLALLVLAWLLLDHIIFLYGFTPIHIMIIIVIGVINVVLIDLNVHLLIFTVDIVVLIASLQWVRSVRSTRIDYLISYITWRVRASKLEVVVIDYHAVLYFAICFIFFEKKVLDAGVLELLLILLVFVAWCSLWYLVVFLMDLDSVVLIMVVDLTIIPVETACFFCVLLGW